MITKIGIMNIKESQLDMRQSYFGGGPGVLVSGLVWIAAGITATMSTQMTSLLVFFIGGMFIHPLGMLLSKVLKRTGKHQKDNPLGRIAMETTLLLFIGLFIAYTVYRIQPDWFYPIMLLMIGGRYVIFTSIYGMRIYWILGLLLIVVGAGLMLTDQLFWVGAIAGGVVEVVFALLIIRMER